MSEAEAKRRAEAITGVAPVAEPIVAAAILAAYREGLTRAEMIAEDEAMLLDGAAAAHRIAATIRTEKGE